MSFREAFASELRNPSTKYFIIDSGKHSGDADFVTYTWHRSINNKIKQGDLFIYRKPQKSSGMGVFYFFGAGRFGQITGDNEVFADIEKPLQFVDPILQGGLEDFVWHSKKRGETWEHFWNQYGINSIDREDFQNILEIIKDDEYNSETEQQIVVQSVAIASGDFFVSDTEAFSKTRPWQAAWSQKVKENFGYECAICGIKAPFMLIGSHIVPVSEDKYNRKNPSNGLCLCVFHDKLFDKGWITITPAMKIQAANSLDDVVLEKMVWEINGKTLKRTMNTAIDPEFIKFHNNNVFKI